MVLNKRSLATIVGSLVAGIAIGYNIPRADLSSEVSKVNLVPENAYVKIEKKEAQSTEDPLGKCPDNMYIALNSYISFEDDNAVGMKAYIIVADEKLFLERSRHEKNVTSFKIPEEILNNNGGYKVIAVDRHGNEMKTRFYTLDGIASTEPFVD